MRLGRFNYQKVGRFHSVVFVYATFPVQFVIEEGLDLEKARDLMQDLNDAIEGKLEDGA